MKKLLLMAALITLAFDSAINPETLNLPEQELFRDWVTAISTDLQNPKMLEKIFDRWPSGNRDCAGLFRYMTAEASAEHGERFKIRFAGSRMAYLPSLSKKIVLRSKNVQSGFADAKTLMEQNSYFLGRDSVQLRTGDLIFFKTRHGFHTMILVREKKSGKMLVIYHTGSNPGELKMLYLEDLREHPEASWHPVSGNPDFLGVFRPYFLQ